MRELVEKQSTISLGDTVEILTFKVGRELFGVDVSNVIELIRADYHITPIPNSEDNIIGMFQPRDHVLTVYDLSCCLFNKHNENRHLLIKEKGKLSEEYLNILHTQNNFIICEYEDTKHAWLVDSVNEIIRIDRKDLHSSIAEKKYITGIYKKDNDTLVQIVDFSIVIDELIYVKPEEIAMEQDTNCE